MRRQRTHTNVNSRNLGGTCGNKGLQSVRTIFYEVKLEEKKQTRERENMHSQPVFDLHEQQQRLQVMAAAEEPAQSILIHTCLRNNT